MERTKKESEVKGGISDEVGGDGDAGAASGARNRHNSVGDGAEVIEQCEQCGIEMTCHVSQHVTM